MSIKSAINLGTGIATIGWPEDGNQSPQFRSSKRIISFIGSRVHSVICHGNLSRDKLFSQIYFCSRFPIILICRDPLCHRILFSYSVPSLSLLCWSLSIRVVSYLFLHIFSADLIQYIILLLWDFNGENGKKCEALRGYLGISMSLPPPRVWLLG